MAFPTLSRPPSYPLDPDGEIEDAVLRSPPAAGYVQQRPKFTRSRQSFGLNYPNLPDADVALLKTWERTTLGNGAGTDTWTHPLSGTTYTVRLGPGLIKYKRARKGAGTEVSMLLQEV